DDELASASRKIAMISSALCLLVFLGIDFLLPGEVSHTKWSEKRGADQISQLGSEFTEYCPIKAIVAAASFGLDDGEDTVSARRRPASRSRRS
ncbi:MAG: hypothetical protein AAF219_08480, partial [Myxococcota bacterium]